MDDFQLPMSGLRRGVTYGQRGEVTIMDSLGKVIVVVS